MNELGLDSNCAVQWFPHEREDPYILVRVSPEHANSWANALRDAIRRCYLPDNLLAASATSLEAELDGTFEARQGAVIQSKLPDPSATMAGDFGEILIYFYQATKALPHPAIGPKKWRLKQDRTKPAPGSDVVHFVLPTWPTPSDHDEILCAEVKTKSTTGTSSPIEEAIADCAKDRTSRLSRTLQWLKERALTEHLGAITIAHLDRFINAADYPAATKRFRAVAVISSHLLEAELLRAPHQAVPEFTVVVLAVPDLHTTYNNVFQAAKESTLLIAEP